jgi:hypothetical protein
MACRLTVSTGWLLKQVRTLKQVRKMALETALKEKMTQGE